VRRKQNGCSGPMKKHGSDKGRGWVVVKRRKDRGFTLIEIMLVVIIISVLAAMIAPRLAGRTDQAKRSVAASDIQAIGLGLKLYELDTGDFPSTEQGLNALITAPVGLANSATWAGPYLEKKPVDSWGRPYRYGYPSQRSLVGYELSSLGKDGVESEDDVTNWEE